MVDEAVTVVTAEAEVAVVVAAAEVRRTPTATVESFTLASLDRL